MPQPHGRPWPHTASWQVASGDSNAIRRSLMSLLAYVELRLPDECGDTEIVLGFASGGGYQRT